LTTPAQIGSVAGERVIRRRDLLHGRNGLKRRVSQRLTAFETDYIVSHLQQM